MTNLASAPASGRPGVLLTGATGFLGGYPVSYTHLTLPTKALV